MVLIRFSRRNVGLGNSLSNTLTRPTSSETSETRDMIRAEFWNGGTHATA